MDDVSKLQGNHQHPEAKQLLFPTSNIPHTFRKAVVGGGGWKGICLVAFAICRPPILLPSSWALDRLVLYFPRVGLSRLRATTQRNPPHFEECALLLETNSYVCLQLGLVSRYLSRIVRLGGLGANRAPLGAFFGSPFGGKLLPGCQGMGR